MKALKFVKIVIDENAKLPRQLINKEITKLPLDVLIKYVADPNGMDILELVDKITMRRCRKGGCTQEDCSQCIVKTGDACRWVEIDLCSACLPKAKIRKAPKNKLR